MTHSLIYRVYCWFKNIYIKSKTINIFSNLLSWKFNIFLHSKVFLLLTSKKSEDIFKESLLIKILKKIRNRLFDISRETTFLENILKNSYYVKLSKNILLKKDQKSIQNLILVFILALLFNFVLKFGIGNFVFKTNILMISILGISIFLYFLKLDYKVILKGSNFVHIFYQILDDKENVGEKNNE